MKKLFEYMKKHGKNIKKLETLSQTVFLFSKKLADVDRVHKKDCINKWELPNNSAVPICFKT